MVKPYRIKHKASGLYYQPASNHSNLSKNGKVYMTNNSPLLINDGYDYVSISVRKGTNVHNILEKLMPLKGVEEFFGKAVYYRVPKSEFEKEELQRMKKISFSLKYLITKYDWCFYFIPSLIVWKPYDGVCEINVGFLLWEFDIRILIKKK